MTATRNCLTSRNDPAPADVCSGPTRSVRGPAAAGGAGMEGTDAAGGLVVVENANIVHEVFLVYGIGNRNIGVVQ